MKNKIFITLLLSIVMFSSCEAYLDKSPDMGVTDLEVYSKYHSFRGALDKVYMLDQDFFIPAANGFVFAIGDEGITTASGDPALSVNNGNYMNSKSIEFSFELLNTAGGTTSDELRYMPIPYLSFKNLRTVNTCLENIDMIEDATSKQKDELRGQIHFYRAWNYFQLIRRFGGFFKFDETFTSNSDMDLPRMSYQESTEWLVEDLDIAIQLLPDKWDTAEKGRATKAAAAALKGMALLYAASPNMNSNGNYNEEYSKRAAEASWKAIEHINTTGVNKLMPGKTIDDYLKIFYSKESLASEEAIFYKVTNSYSNADVYGMPSVAAWNASILVNSREKGNVHLAAPTQNIVDLFETKNGLAIGDDNSYNDQDPYSNRDPRFYRSILYNGLEWNWDGATHKKLEFWEADTYQNKVSEDMMALPQYYPRSPYMIRKWLPESCNKWQNDYNYYMQSIHIRVAQLYLDFAEAANEAYGPTTKVPGANMSAVEAINILRERVGHVAVPSQYTTSKEEFRKRIYNERSVELCFENHRWHDIRRWRIAKDVLKEIRKAVITRVGDDQYSFKYVRVANSMQRVFEDKHYWYPIPQSQMEMLSVFTQAPGW